MSFSPINNFNANNHYLESMLASNIINHEIMSPERDLSAFQTDIKTLVSNQSSEFNHDHQTFAYFLV